MILDPLAPSSLGTLQAPTLYSSDDPHQDIDRYLITTQGFHRWEENVIKNSDPRGRKYYWIGGTKLPYKGGTETDVGAVTAGFISVTPLHVDMTNYQFAEILKKREKQG